MKHYLFIKGGIKIEAFKGFIADIEQKGHQERTQEVLAWIIDHYPKLVPEIKWNQPMFTDHGTYIIGFSVAKQHLAVAPENAGIIQFADEIEKAGYTYTNQLFRIKWNQSVDYSLMEKIIDFNILDKADCSTFWRK